MKHVIFDSSNVNLLYLSPYCNIIKLTDGVFFERTDIDKSFSVDYDIYDLFESLKYGVELTELLELFGNKVGKEEGSELVRFLMLRKIII